MQLTNTELHELYSALVALSEGRSEPDGEKTKSIPYKFSGITLLKLARNIHALKQPALSLQDVVTRRRRDIINGEATPSIDKVVAFENEVGILLEHKDEYNLVTIKEDELALDENNIPPLVIAGIIPILE